MIRATLGRRYQGGWGTLAGLLMATCLLGTQSAQADLEVSLQVEHRTLCRLEAANVLVTVSNNGLQSVTLDPQRGPGHAWLDFDVRRVDDRATQTLTLSPAPAAGEIEPGSSRRFLLDLSRLCDLSQIGNYNIAAYVERNDLRYQSRVVGVVIVTPLPIKTVSHESPLSPKAERRYTLSYLAREGREELLLSVDETPTDLNYGVFPLGPIVRVMDPVLEVSAKGMITVVHQIGPRRYARSLLETTAGGVRMVDQSYQTLQGHVGAAGNWEAPRQPLSEGEPSPSIPTSGRSTPAF